MSDSNLKCESCKRSDINLKRCSQCYNAHYCSKICQKADRKHHKKICKNTGTEFTERTKVENKILKGTCETDERTIRKFTENIKHKMHDDSSLKPIMQRANSISIKDKLPDKTATTRAVCKTSKNTDYNKSISISDKHDVKKGAYQNCSTVHCSLRCTGCWDTYYCSKECQQRHWLLHKTYCKPPALINTSKNDPAPDGAKNSGISFKDWTINEHGCTERTIEYNNTKLFHCLHCKIFGATKTCSKCKIAYYCSKPCQHADWPRHRSCCEKVYTKEEKKIIDDRLRRKKMACEDTFTSALKNHFCTFGSQPGGMERYLATLTPEQALITEISHPGSLSKATRMVSLLYPSHDVITLFSKVPWEPLSPGSMMRKSPNVLVAFMFRYHEHVMRHGVYLKDAENKDSKVEFYLDHISDNPFPYFTYAKVKPGNYICIKDPLMHAYVDGTVGIKVEDPQLVKILEKETLKQ